MGKIVRLKPMITLVVLVILLACAATASRVEFSADIFQELGGNTSEGKVYVKGDKMRFENTEAMGGTITIIEMNKANMFVIHPEEKMYVELEATGFDPIIPQSAKASSEISDKKHLGTEEVNGYECDKYLYTYKDKSLGVITQWVSRKLNFPIKVSFPAPEGVMNLEYRNIREEGVEDWLFQIPTGYRKMEIPGRGEQMGKD
jgi:hypothetical protein